MIKFFRKQNKTMRIVSENKSVLELQELKPYVPLFSLPTWFKRVKQLTNGSSFFYDKNVTEGLTVPLWADVLLTTDSDGEPETFFRHKIVEFEICKEEFIEHLPSNNDYVVVKALCPWRVFTPKGYSIRVQESFYNFNLDFKILPQKIDTDKEHTLTIYFMVKRGEDVYLKRETPFFQIVPYKRDGLDYNIGVMTEEEKLKNLKSIFR